MISLLDLIESARLKAGSDGEPPAAHRSDAVNASDVDAGRLKVELRERLRGEVRFDDATRGMYATDASNYRQVPIGVVVPRDAADAIATVKTCRTFGAPILARGGGTSLAGQCCNVAVVMNMSKYMNRILEIDYEKRFAWVEPGCNLDTLRDKVMDYLGPISEGAVSAIIGVGFLFWVIYFTGTKADGRRLNELDPPFGDRGS